MSELMMRTIPAIALVVILGGLWLATKRLQRRGGGPGLKMVGRVALLRGASVAVAEFEGRRYLIGATEQRVEMLAELGMAQPDTDVDAAVLNLNESISGPWMDLFNRVRAEHAAGPSKAADATHT